MHDTTRSVCLPQSLAKTGVSKRRDTIYGIYLTQQKPPRVKRLLNKVGSKVLIIVYYAPVIAYIYTYVLYNGIKSYSKHMTKSWHIFWQSFDICFDILLTCMFDSYLTGVPPTPHLPEYMSPDIDMELTGRLSLFSIPLKNSEICVKFRA